jgi:hypothetical protein
MPDVTAANSFIQRLIGAISLDSTIYEEVEADRAATGQALAVVLLSSLAAGIGSRGLVGTTIAGIVFIAVVALIAWAAWALVILQVGGRLLPEPETRVDVGELLRTIGFASAPGLLRILGVMSAVTIPVFVVTAIWMLLAMIVGVRQALDYRSTARAVAVCGIGFLLAVTIAVVLGLFFGPAVS